MRILIVGASGAIGRPLVPRLVAAGHEVIGTTRSPAKFDDLRASGAQPLQLDVLDRQAAIDAVRDARPDAIVQQTTALTDLNINIRSVDRAFAATNRLRSDGTDNLIAAAQAAGVRRLVSQSFAGWPYAREGGPVKDEDDPLDESPPAAMRVTTAAIRHLESAVLGAEGIEGIVVRYGGFYGPGTDMEAGGSIAKTIRRRRFPVVGGGGGVWSFVHVEDAADATVAIVERGTPGIYNVVDDEPAPVSEWLPRLAQALGARPPRRVPAWLARLVAGEPAVVMMTESRGASNAKAKRELDWSPSHPSWREGFGKASA